MWLFHLRSHCHLTAKDCFDTVPGLFNVQCYNYSCHHSNQNLYFTACLNGKASHDCQLTEDEG